MLQVTVATEPPAMALPGLFAVKGIVLGVACSWLTVLNPLWLAAGKTGVGWCVFTVFCARAIPQAKMKTPVAAIKMLVRIPVSLSPVPDRCWLRGERHALPCLQ
jgi:hypothetical protein